MVRLSSFDVAEAMGSGSLNVALRASSKPYQVQAKLGRSSSSSVRLGSYQC